MNGGAAPVPGGGGFPGGDVLGRLSGLASAILGGTKVQTTLSQVATLGAAVNPAISVIVGEGEAAPSTSGSASPSVSAPVRADQSDEWPDFFLTPGALYGSAAQPRVPQIDMVPAGARMTTAGEPLGGLFGDIDPMLLLVFGGGALWLMMKG